MKKTKKKLLNVDLTCVSAIPFIPSTASKFQSLAKAFEILELLKRQARNA